MKPVHDRNTTTMRSLVIEKAAAQFGKGEQEIEPLGEGLIHRTYKVTYHGTDRPIVLQCLNQTTFPQPENIINNYRIISQLGEDIEIMNPFQNIDSWKIAEVFYRKFYNDTNRRIFIFGINPGRFGGGITGIPFTDPIRLEGACGIPNDFRKIGELSSIFVYEVILEYGGAEKFYNDFFITALSPLGYTKKRNQFELL